MNKMLTLIRKTRGHQSLLKKLHLRSRSSKSNSSASDQVLYSPELLECIMMYLPERDLLINAQRVNQLWHSVITTFCSLTQKLYFQPLPLTKDITESIANPILLELFPPWFRSFERDVPYTSIQRKDFRNLDWNSSKAKREAYRRKDASWRRMLVVQPPIIEITHTAISHQEERTCTRWSGIGDRIMYSKRKVKETIPEGRSEASIGLRVYENQLKVSRSMYGFALRFNSSYCRLPRA